MANEHDNKMIVEIGQTVEINPRDDNSRKLRVSGIVKEVLTKNQNHPHGVLVRLATGEVGRVKSIEQPNTSNPTRSHKTAPNVPNLIAAGENHHLEFKTDALWSANYTADDIKNHRPQTKDLHTYGKATSKIIIAKALAAFLNSDGGHLLIGFKEGKGAKSDEVIGIDVELAKLKDSTIDGYRRMLVELIKEYFPSSIFNHFNQYFKIEFERFCEKTLCVITAKKSPHKVFLKLKGKDHFFVRVDASTRELIGEEIVDFCDLRFSKSM